MRGYKKRLPPPWNFDVSECEITNKTRWLIINYCYFSGALAEDDDLKWWTSEENAVRITARSFKIHAPHPALLLAELNSIRKWMCKHIKTAITEGQFDVIMQFLFATATSDNQAEDVIDLFNKRELDAAIAYMTRRTAEQRGARHSSTREQMAMVRRWNELTEKEKAVQANT